MFSSRYQRFLGLLFVCSLTFCLWLGYSPLLIWQEQQREVVYAQSPDANQLMRQGVESYEVGKLQDAIKHWEDALKISQRNNNRVLEATVNEKLARIYQQTGQLDNSIVHWDKVIAYYREVGNVGQVGRTLTEQAQVYSSLGQPKKVIALLCGVFQEDQEPLVEKKCLPFSALEIARAQKDEVGEVGALGSLGEAYRLMGSYNWAIKYLENAEKFAREGYDFLVHNSLGNAYISRAQLWKLRAKSAEQIGSPNDKKFEQYADNDYKEAFANFQSSLEKAEEQGNQFYQVQVLVNLIKFHYHAQSKADQNNVNALIEKALALREKLPDSTSKVYITIDLANLPVAPKILTSSLTQCLERQLPDARALALFQDAIKIASNIEDSRSKSFANGALGHFYECGNSYEQALKFTRNALVEADQKLLAKDSVYLWEWQTGRILRAQGNNSEVVINAYQQAYSTLEKIRSDILSADKDLQFDFRDVVEPLYRDLAQLKLEFSLLSVERKKQLNSALKTIDSLRLAELQNYFGNDCIIAAINQFGNANNSLNKDTAVLSSIVFNDRTAILLSLPDGSKRLKWINEKREVLEREVEEFRTSLVSGVKTLAEDEIKVKGKHLYEEIFGDNIIVDLNPNKIKNLVFIQDSFFRSIPMAALHDGEKYLIEKYAIATTPSLSLTAPKKSNLQNSKALILAVTTASEVNDKKYAALPYVKPEVNNVKSIFKNYTILENNDFNFENLKKKLKTTVYPIIHVSTHAQFGIIADDTFLVAGNNGKVTIKDLETALRQVNNDLHSIELLTLTACQTAVGDDRATLGLAGVALQVGVKSAIASLWPVNDESTYKLISAFYTNLHNSKMSKAEALRQAQIKFIYATKKDEDVNKQYSNPAYWAPFVLSGDWL
ncbi:TPR repeat [Rivularia sp. IAM M-261]|nr:TPR repeat [Rivularia sp. IAM M-261]